MNSPVVEFEELSIGAGKPIGILNIVFSKEAKCEVSFDLFPMHPEECEALKNGEDFDSHDENGGEIGLENEMFYGRFERGDEPSTAKFRIPKSWLSEKVIEAICKFSSENYGIDE